MAAFDCTYLTSTLAQFKLHDKVGLVGGVFKPECIDHAFLNMQNEIEATTIVRAGTMLELVAWDPAAVQKRVLSLCSLPIESNFSGPGSVARGSWFFLDLLGRVFEHGGEYIKAITFDAHGNHSIVRRVLHGQVDGLSQEDIQKIPFWRDLSYRAPPPCILPRLPIQITLHKGDPIYGIPAVCH